MKKIKSSLIALSALSVLSTACLKVEDGIPFVKTKKKSNRVTNSRETNQIIGDSEVQIQVISESKLKEAALTKSILSISNPRAMKILNSLPHTKAAKMAISASVEAPTAQEESLVVGFPLGLVGEQNIFGGVITKVTDQDSTFLGDLKLTDLPPIHVRTAISNTQEGLALTLVGCPDACEEDSEQMGLLSFPILGFNESTGMIMVDMSAIGKSLDLISMLDPKGEATKLKTIASDTTTVDYDMKTLVFDVKSKMIPVTADVNDTSVKTTDFTVRWYLKLGSGFNPAFKSREATEGVGFFKTSRGASTKITRFSTTGDGTGQAPVKYFIKNVPEQFKKSFAKAMDSWNVEFKKIVGKEMLRYEFVDATDPRAELLVPGDIRFNIIEWDLVNKASYGGLGPSIANQITGETMSANVLVQGPTIVRLYTQWFAVSGQASKLLAEGKSAEANQLIKNFETSASAEMASRKTTISKVKLGEHLEMNIHSQRASLEDPMLPKEFEIVPQGMTYEKYMEGYMVEILAHEVGHNLGLRHNFKGNLGSYENGAEPGSVSRSVMEYLGRPYRHLNTIGPYDRMAIAYGYKGVTPGHKDWFCTDEDQGLDEESIKVKSAECTKSDATSDPFSFWEARFDRIIDLLVDTKSGAAPAWTVKDVSTQLDDTITGLTSYAMSADATAQTWTNFFGKNDRPENKAEIKNYVFQKIKSRICNPELTIIIASKESQEAQKAAQDNLDVMTKFVNFRTKSLGWDIEKDLNCTK